MSFADIKPALIMIFMGCNNLIATGLERNLSNKDLCQRIVGNDLLGATRQLVIGPDWDIW